MKAPFTPCHGVMAQAKAGFFAEFSPHFAALCRDERSLSVFLHERRIALPMVACLFLYAATPFSPQTSRLYALRFCAAGCFPSLRDAASPFYATRAPTRPCAAAIDVSSRRFHREAFRIIAEYRQPILLHIRISRFEPHFEEISGRYRVSTLI